jgi:hypothetical protein
MKQNRVSVSGHIDNAPKDEMTYLEEVRISSNRIIDSTRIRKNGTFSYRKEIKNPGFYQLRLRGGKLLTLILSPGENLKITADFDDFYNSKTITGSPNTERVNVLHDSLRIVILELNKLRALYSGLSDSIPDYKEIGDSLSSRFIDLKSKHHKYSVKFILEDLRSLPNIAALYQEYAPDEYVFHNNRDIQYFKLVSDTLQKYYPDVRHVRAVRNNYRTFISSYNTQRIMKSTEVISYTVPDLDLPSTTGKNVKLSSLKGKYVLLSFWSINQDESVRNMLEFKSVYNKLDKNKFEIYQVSLDNSFENFRKRVFFEEIDWISVCDTAFPASSTQSLYNITTVPMNYLLNLEQNEILVKNISPENLETTLNYLLTRK